MNAERAVALLKEADPAGDLEAIELPQSYGTAYLEAAERRVAELKTQEHTGHSSHADRVRARPTSRWRGSVIATAAAIAVFLLVGVASWLLGDSPRQTPIVDEPVPTTAPQGPTDLSPDLSNVGEVLTAAHNANDPEVFLRLFADNAEFQFFGSASVSPGDIRSGAPLAGAGGHYQYDRDWARVMNQRYEYSSCQVNGDRALCDMTAMSDWLQPLYGPEPHTIAVQVRNGQIVLLVVSNVSDPSDAIRADFQDWTQEHHPDEATRMWVNDWEPVEMRTEESALLHLRLGRQYVQEQP